ncbi:MAG TPA: glycine zipper 2TM domain-containing protein [Arenimonas sp.]|nr:glycine zipper 2TM domain-containing protein [Arenimonas sp.]
MKATALLSLLALATTAASAQTVDNYYSEPVPENVSYGWAQVLRVEPIYELVRTRTPEERCDGYVQEERSGTAGTVIGAIVGAAIGNQVGKGDGRKAATVAGAVAGGAIGRNIDKNKPGAVRPGCQIVEVEREQRQLTAFDVEYQYKGEKYMSRLPYDPGNRLRVRVSVTPEDEGRPSY